MAAAGKRNHGRANIGGGTIWERHCFAAPPMDVDSLHDHRFTGSPIGSRGSMIIAPSLDRI